MQVIKHENYSVAKNTYDKLENQITFLTAGDLILDSSQECTSHNITLMSHEN